MKLFGLYQVMMVLGLASQHVIIPQVEMHRYLWRAFFRKVQQSLKDNWGAEIRLLRSVSEKLDELVTCNLIVIVQSGRWTWFHRMQKLFHRIRRLFSRLAVGPFSKRSAGKCTMLVTFQLPVDYLANLWSFLSLFRRLMDKKWMGRVSPKLWIFCETLAVW